MLGLLLDEDTMLMKIDMVFFLLAGERDDIKPIHRSASNRKQVVISALRTRNRGA